MPTTYSNLTMNLFTWRNPIPPSKTNVWHTTFSFVEWGIFSHDVIPSLCPKHSWQFPTHYILLHGVRNLFTWCNPIPPSKTKLTISDILHPPSLDEESCHMMQSHRSIQNRIDSLRHTTSSSIGWCIFSHDSIPFLRPKTISNTLHPLPLGKESFHMIQFHPSF